MILLIRNNEASVGMFQFNNVVFWLYFDSFVCVIYVWKNTKTQKENTFKMADEFCPELSS